ncbi:hypothetical protein AK830_g2164 [Neonectria ditissima]|uniref:Uncharacterized protein n=1 Tax=Neonectria ditissima TaxID=78410 RepID=A0A0P7BVA9_9HYPO|nr:hypothetical protein AK830_g2164 [Neonectria ditissima]
MQYHDQDAAHPRDVTILLSPTESTRITSINGAATRHSPQIAAVADVPNFLGFPDFLGLAARPSVGSQSVHPASPAAARWESRRRVKSHHYNSHRHNPPPPRIQAQTHAHAQTQAHAQAQARSTKHKLATRPSPRLWESFSFPHAQYARCGTTPRPTGNTTLQSGRGMRCAALLAPMLLGLPVRLSTGENDGPAVMPSRSLVARAMCEASALVWKGTTGHGKNCGIAFDPFIP